VETHRRGKSKKKKVRKIPNSVKIGYPKVALPFIFWSPVPFWPFLTEPP
jgi:hypothetical protein